MYVVRQHVTETAGVLCTAYGNEWLSWTCVLDSHSLFKADRVSVEDDEHSGQPSTNKMTENVEKLRALIHEDCRQTIQELADIFGISYGVCQEILTENLNMCCIVAKFVPPTLDYFEGDGSQN
jgi:hypothetical protein